MEQLNGVKLNTIKSCEIEWNTATRLQISFVKFNLLLLFKQLRFYFDRSQYQHEKIRFQNWHFYSDKTFIWFNDWCQFRLYCRICIKFYNQIISRYIIVQESKILQSKCIRRKADADFNFELYEIESLGLFFYIELDNPLTNPTRSSDGWRNGKSSVNYLMSPAYARPLLFV